MTKSDILKDNARRLLTYDSQTDALGKIIDRKEQQEQLDEEVFDPLKEDELGQPTTYIYGGAGTGKTYTVNVKAQEVEDTLESPDFDSVYINGRKYTTYHKFLVKLLDQLSHRLPIKVNGKTVEHPKVGNSKSVLYDTFRKLLEEKEFKVLVTLDEIDKMDKDCIDDIISMFWDMRGEGYPVQLVSISNDRDLTERFDGNIDRRIALNVTFTPYNAVQLADILEEFAEICLKEDTWDREELIRIAGEVAETSGSASEAKKLLYHTAKRSDGHLNADSMNQAKDTVEKHMLKDEIYSRPLHHKLTLLAVAKTQEDYAEAKRSPRRTHPDEDAPTTQNILKKYQHICKKFNTESKSKRTLVRAVNDLKRDDLVSYEVEGLGRGKGVTKKHSLMYDAEMMEELILESLENDIGVNTEKPVQEVTI